MSIRSREYRLSVGPAARHRARLFPAVAGLFLAAWSGQTCMAQEWREVFNPMAVVTIHLQIDPADWDRVRFDQPVENETWAAEVAQASFWSEGESPILASVRRKGETDMPLPESLAKLEKMLPMVRKQLDGNNRKGYSCLHEITLPKTQDTLRV